MNLTREQAWTKLNELIDNPNLIKHCIAVEAAMKAYSEHFNVSKDDQEKWLVAGLIHDADWEKYPKEHPQVILQWLREQDVDENVINAVNAHGFDFGIEAKTLMAKTLRAVDELTGLIVAVTLVRESKKIADVTVESIMKKWGISGFAKGVDRSDIERGAEEIGVSLEEHVQIVLSSMQGIADELGL